MVSLKQLSHAIALKNYKNFHQAAKAVCISQPAFSLSISTLEAALGVTLFNRGTGIVTPTVYGEALIERAELLLAETDEMLRDIQLLKGLEAGRLSVAMGVFAADISANRTLGEMVRRYPNLYYESRLSPWYEVATQVKSSVVDLGVVEISNLTQESHLKVESVGRHGAVFFVRREHPLLRKKRITASDMSTFPLATVRLPARVAELMPGRGEIDPGTGEFVPSVCVNDLVTMRAVVSCSDTIGTAAPVQIESWLRAGELECLPYRPAWMTLDYGVIYLKDRKHSPTMEEFIKLLYEIDAQQGALNDALIRELTGPGITSGK